MADPGRNERRKAQTRAAIVRAAERLFQRKGYIATSMDDIAVEAEVAIRTIYLHFDSKAAVLLAYFDDWLEEFIRLVGERPPGGRLDDAVTRALAAMAADGWGDDKRAEDLPTLHPVTDFLGSGSPEVAGHILQRWVAAQETLAERFRVTAGLPLDATSPRVEAAAVFAAWITTALDFRARFREGIAGASSHDIGAIAIRSFVDGLAARD